MLFSRRQRGFLICNPATRQWASLPPLTPEPCSFVEASGLYFHRPSGERRVLCIGHLPERGYRYDPACGAYCSVLSRGDVDVPAAADYIYRSYYVLSAGKARRRRLCAVAMGKRIRQHGTPSPCVALGTTLYWSRHPEAVESDSIVAFDTLSETFRSIRPPPLVGGRDRHQLRLFDMDGTLALSAATKGSPCTQVWTLGEAGDGEGKTWSCILRLHDGDLPPPRPLEWMAAVAVLEGGVLLLVGSGWVVRHMIREKRTVSSVDHNAGIRNLSMFHYRASLAPLTTTTTEPPPPPDAQAQMPCRRGQQLLEYPSPDALCMPLSGYKNCGMWIVPNGV